MDRRTYVAALATVASGAGGCLRLSSGGGTPTDRATAPGQATERGGTDTATATGTRAGYPTGLSDDGVSMLLLDRHVAALSRTPYTVDYVKRNLTESRRAAETLAVEGERALYEQESAGVDSFIEVTPAEYDRVTWRTTADRTTLFGDVNVCCIGYSRGLAYAKEGHGGSMQFLFWALKAGDYGEPAPAEDGEGFHIAADGVANPAPVLDAFEADRVESFSADGVVTPAGIVRRMRVSTELVRGDDLLGLEFAFDVSALGATTVTAPDWLETARSRAPTIAASMRDDRRGVVYTHEGGDPVPAGSRVGLHAHGEENTLAADGEESALETALEPGESLVAYVAGDRVTHALGGLPSGADAAELPSEGWTNLESPAGPEFFKQGFQRIS